MAFETSGRLICLKRAEKAAQRVKKANKKRRDLSFIY